MTGRTHDLVAFTALNIVFVTQAVPPMTLSTLAVAFGANMIGGLLPDIDEAASDIWDKIRWGHVIGRIIHPLLGQHRMVSHSLLGMVVISYVLRYVLMFLGTIVLVDMDVVWWSVMIGYFSHLVADSITTQGVPWLFPIPIRFGIPPFKFMRIKTGGLIEKAIVFPGLFFLNGYLIYLHYPLYETFFKSYIK